MNGRELVFTIVSFKSELKEPIVLVAAVVVSLNLFMQLSH